MPHHVCLGFRLKELNESTWNLRACRHKRRQTVSGYRRTVDSKLSTLVNLGQPWSILVNLVNLGPRLFLLPWPTFLSTLGLPMRQNILMKFTWPSKELKELYDIWNAWKVVQCGAVPQDHPSTGASFFFFFLRRLLSEESDSDSLLLDSFRMRMAENRN